MSEYYYNLCNQHVGRVVEIHTHDGVIHHGVINRVDREHVYIHQIDPNRLGGLDSPGGGFGGPGGPGVFVWGFPGAFAGGFLGGLTGVALGSIAFFRPYPFFW